MHACVSIYVRCRSQSPSARFYNDAIVYVRKLLFRIESKLCRFYYIVLMDYESKTVPHSVGRCFVQRMRFNYTSGKFNWKLRRCDVEIKSVHITLTQFSLW